MMQTPNKRFGSSAQLPSLLESGSSSSFGGGASGNHHTYINTPSTVIGNHSNSNNNNNNNTNNNSNGHNRSSNGISSPLRDNYRSMFRFSLPLPSSARLTLLAAIATMAFVIIGFISFQHSPTSLSNPNLTTTGGSHISNTNKDTNANGIALRKKAEHVPISSPTTGLSETVQANNEDDVPVGLPPPTPANGNGEPIIADDPSSSSDTIGSDELTNTDDNDNNDNGDAPDDDTTPTPPRAARYLPVVQDGSPHPYGSPLIRQKSRTQLPFRM
jgi:hypothetical protein